MSFELINTAAAVGTFAVITATAIAASVQLRHLRLNNQLSGLQGVFEMLRDPSVREIMNFVRHDLAEHLKDERFRASLLEIPVDRRGHPEQYLCDMYNHIGSFVRSGLIDENIYLQSDWFNVILYWNLLADVIAIVRTNRPYLYENFEYIAARARIWAANHPAGDYPTDTPRML